MNITLATFVLTNNQRPHYLNATIKSLEDSDNGPYNRVLRERDLFHDVGYNYEHQQPRTRSALAWRLMLAKFAATYMDFGLFFEDDVEVGYHIRHNVDKIIRQFHGDDDFLATLWNPGYPVGKTLCVDPMFYRPVRSHVHGSMALLMDRPTTIKILDLWCSFDGRTIPQPQDLQIFNTVLPICHNKSFVEHIGDVSTISTERKPARANNFNKNYKL